MDQAFMLMVRGGPAGPPPDAELARMGMTRAQAIDLAARMDARQLAALQRTGRGAYRVTIDPRGTSHDDFGDLPVLQAADRAEAASRTATLSAIRRYTRAFFDVELRGAPRATLDRGARPPLILDIERFRPARRSAR